MVYIRVANQVAVSPVHVCVDGLRVSLPTRQTSDVEAVVCEDHPLPASPV